MDPELPLDCLSSRYVESKEILDMPGIILLKQLPQIQKMQILECFMRQSMPLLGNIRKLLNHMRKLHDFGLKMLKHLSQPWWYCTFFTSLSWICGISSFLGQCIASYWMHFFHFFKICTSFIFLKIRWTPISLFSIVIHFFFLGSFFDHSHPGKWLKIRNWNDIFYSERFIYLVLSILLLLKILNDFWL